jgi:hypothetical protein
LNIWGKSESKDDANFFYCGNVASQPMGEGKIRLILRRGCHWMTLDNIIISSSRHQHQTLASYHHHSYPEEVTASTPPDFTIQEVWWQSAPK